MEKNRWLNGSLFLATLLSGFYGGMGFFTFIGGNPAVAQLGDRAFAEYWQSIDSFMAQRMPVFGPLLMLSILLAAVLLFRRGFRMAAWLLMTALAVLIVDIAFTLTVNHPYNRLIQSWDLNNLPANVSHIKERVIAAFDTRRWLMLLPFILVLTGLWQKNERYASARLSGTPGRALADA